MNEEQQKSPLDTGVMVTEVKDAMLEFFRSDEFKRLVKEATTEKQSVEIHAIMRVAPALALRRRQALG
jgi:hypothetical protein